MKDGLIIAISKDFLIITFISVIFALNAAGAYGILTNENYSESKKMFKFGLQILGLFLMLLFAIYHVVLLALEHYNLP